jgi:class 3 adenylate cyclase
VDRFTLKGFDEPVAVYLIDQTHRTRVIEDQYIVVTDLRGFFGLAESHVMTAIEKVLDRLFDLVGRMCREFGGNNRFSSGDSYCLTFSDPDAAIAAVERLYEVWSGLRQRESFYCPINIAVHKGTLYAFRSFLYGVDVNILI